MKKIILIILMFIPVIAFGTTCEYVRDDQTTSTRNLACDAEKRTVTVFKTNDEKEVLKNDVCEIKCTEEILFSIDPIKKVLAGTGFNYPLYASGERKCTAKYNYVEYENTIKNYLYDYNVDGLSESQKQTYLNQITNYYSQKKACDEFYKRDSEYENRYEYSGDVTLKIQTSTNEVTVPYEFIEMAEYSSTVILDEVNYDACNYSESNRKCLSSNKTISGWSETARIYGKYTMDDTHLEKYTGEVKNVSGANTCNAGDKYFTKVTEKTSPVQGDTTSKGYELNLTANNLGHNLTSITSSENWNLNVKCYYQVKNIIHPQRDDENYDPYGGTAFQYRIIDVDNPFPGREANANWKGKEDLITGNAANLSMLQRFVITLNRSSINKIREYNDVHSYDTFNLSEMEKSSFIEANPNIIDRK